MIESLLIALVYIAIIMVVGWLVVHLVSTANPPPVVITLVWGVFVLLALLILLRVFVGGSFAIP